MTNEDLRQRAREAIRGGRIPTGRPERMWGGPGGGDTCTICSQPVGELGIDLEFARDGKYPVHVDCYAAWRVECESRIPLVPGD
jgi:hypothetical protein